LKSYGDIMGHELAGDGVNVHIRIFHP
jgi:hypothetical protein